MAVLVLTATTATAWLGFLLQRFKRMKFGSALVESLVLFTLRDKGVLPLETPYILVDF